MYARFFTPLRLVFACLLAAVTPLRAHVSDTSLLRVQILADKLQIEANVDLLTLNRIQRLDSDGDGAVTREEFLRATPALEDFFRKKLQLTVGGDAPFLGEAKIPEWQDPRPAASGDELQAVHANFVFVRERPAGAKGFRLENGVFNGFGSTHNVIFALVEGETTQQAVLTAETPGLDYEFANPVTNGGAPARSDGSGGLFNLGVRHILEGYDHLLFLLTLLVVAGGWRQMVVIITAFTAAHSVTVGLAVFGVARLPEKLVECAIAASIAWVAAENLWKGGGPSRWRQTFLFGLLHGFGFAGALMELQLPREGLAWSLLFFNAGVEAGQLLVVAPVFPLLLLLRKTPFHRLIQKALSFGALATALVWLAQRLGV